MDFWCIIYFIEFRVLISGSCAARNIINLRSSAKIFLPRKHVQAYSRKRMRACNEMSSRGNYGGLSLEYSTSTQLFHSSITYIVSTSYWTGSSIEDKIKLDRKLSHSTSTKAMEEDSSMCELNYSRQNKFKQIVSKLRRFQNKSSLAKIQIKQQTALT